MSMQRVQRVLLHNVLLNIKKEPHQTLNRLFYNCITGHLLTAGFFILRVPKKHTFLGY